MPDRVEVLHCVVGEVQNLKRLMHESRTTRKLVSMQEGFYKHCDQALTELALAAENHCVQC